MKNFKKIAAFGIAAAMTMSMGVSAFAEITGTALYENGAVKLQNLAGLDADHQWTVVVIDKDNGNKDLTADMLYYINQGTNGETFWTDGMGTKTGLKDGEYIVRIGGETLDTVVEIPLKVTSSTGTQFTFVWGDVNGDGSADSTDASSILGTFVGDPAKVGTSRYAIGEKVIDGIIWGDVNADSSADSTDASSILGTFVGDPAKVGSSIYSIGESVTITIPSK